MPDPLFEAIDALFHKKPVEAIPGLFVVNRFLAWEPAYAPYAAAVSRIRDDAMAWEVWRGALPRKHKAPWLRYPAPKRQPAAEALVLALMERTHLSRARAEEAVDIMTATGTVDDAMAAYGVEHETE